MGRWPRWTAATSVSVHEGVVKLLVLGDDPRIQSLYRRHRFSLGTESACSRLDDRPFTHRTSRI